VLADQVKAMRSLTTGLNQHLEEEKGVIKEMDSGFDKTKSAVGQVVGRMDDLLGHASSSITCYVILFLLIFIVLLCKLT